ncbi:MAG: flagellar M-ring protein FliF C-terminal domain-containing protein [Phycisphaerales bacterium JB061]
MLDSFGRILKNATDQLGKLTPTARLLVLMTVVVMGMMLILVSIWAGGPARAELYAGADPEFKSQAITTLRSGGIDADLDAQGRLLVRHDDAARAEGLLASQGVLPSDGALLFSNLSEQMKWTNPREVNQQMFHMALQNELARTISNFPNMRKASVFLDIPAPTGIGMAARRPTASVTVFTRSGTPVKQTEVDAVARLVSKAVSGLDLSNISVIDGSTGTPLRARTDDDAIATNYLEHKLQFEREVEQKVMGILAAIPGATVAVTADVDVKRVTSRREAYLKNNEGTVSLPRSTSNLKEESLSANVGAEPGTRPNTGADINTASSGGGGFLKTDDTTEFDSRVGSEVTSTIDPRGMATSLSISVQVPRRYIEALVPKADDAAEDEPVDSAAVEQAFAAERDRIREMIEPHLPTSVDGEGVRQAAGQVVVSMMPIDLASFAGTAQAAAFGMPGGGNAAGGGGGMLGMLLGSGLIEKGVLIALAGVAFVMMLLMVKSATKRVELPSVEELVGIPPALEQPSDIVGEADETEAPMDGIEVDSQHVASSKMLEQVGSLVSNEPDLAARLLNRWIQPDH